MPHCVRVGRARPHWAAVPPTDRRLGLRLPAGCCVHSDPTERVKASGGKSQSLHPRPSPKAARTACVRGTVLRRRRGQAQECGGCWQSKDLGKCRLETGRRLGGDLSVLPGSKGFLCGRQCRLVQGAEPRPGHSSELLYFTQIRPLRGPFAGADTQGVNGATVLHQGPRALGLGGRRRKPP